jgi:glycyl-tRNA synthetase beta chain
MSDILLEIFSEEIPSRMQKKALKDLRNIVITHFTKQSIQYENLETFVTPRRLVLHVSGGRYSDAVNENEFKRGPKLGAKEIAVEGFLKSAGLKKTDLQIKEVNGQEYYFAEIKKTMNSFESAISDILEKIFFEMSWAKSMRWDHTNVTWVRPIRNILCLLDGKILPVEFGSLKSNDISFGHRFLAPESFKVKSFEDYKKSLKNKFVILDREERKRKALDQARKLAKKKNIEVVEDPELFDEVTGLVEYPTAILGRISKKFLKLPKEILSTSIKLHQRYFSLQDKQGKVAPYFITISNNYSSDNSSIIEGNERVLRARLCDAEFFFDEDKKISLDQRVDKLKGVVFHKKLGTVFDRVSRMSEVSEKLCKALGVKDIENVKRAALLSKTDLTTYIVGDFPELQGIAGRYYAEEFKENSVVSQAIYEHYMPRGRQDECPETIESGVVGIAEKIDTIVGLFSIGEVPSSSKDPYGLRRNALGIIRIIIELDLNFRLEDIVDAALDSYNITHKDEEKLSKDIEKFFYERFRHFLKGDFKENIVASIFNKSSKDINQDYKKIKYLSEFLNSSSGKEVYFAAKRVIAILESDKHSVGSDVSISLLKNDQEKNLHSVILKIQPQIEKYSKNGEFALALESFKNIVSEIDMFFDKTMIMDEDKVLRKNRLALLNMVADIFNVFVDFSPIEL